MRIPRTSPHLLMTSRSACSSISNAKFPQKTVLHPSGREVACRGEILQSQSPSTFDILGHYKLGLFRMCLRHFAELAVQVRVA